MALIPALAGCGLISSDGEEAAIPPADAAGPAEDLELGPGVRALSYGPGDKGSPRVSPSGERVAFVLDGYVTEKSLYTRDLHYVAPEAPAGGAEWLLDGGLAVLGEATPAPSPLLVARPDGSEGSSPEGSPDGALSGGSSGARELVEGVEAASVVPGGGYVVAATATPPEPGPLGETQKAEGSSLVLVRGSGEGQPSAEVYPGRIAGQVTGLSISPDGRQAVLAVRDGEGGFEIQVYEFSEGLSRRVVRVPEGLEVLGAPQWTRRGIYFVAGEAGHPGGPADNAAAYALYRAPEGSEAPEPVRAAGEGFAAASISASPDGERLAVVGRRNPGSPTNLYVLDPASDALEAVTANESMEIKTNPRDLAWSPDNSSVVVVARGTLSGPEVYDTSADDILSAFYNLYEVPVGSPSAVEREGP